MKRLILSKRKFSPTGRPTFAIVSDEDYTKLRKYRWHLNPNDKGKRFYVARCYYRAGVRKYTYLHRQIMRARKGQSVDHVNHDTLDCRRENLRFAGGWRNNANSRLRKTNKTGFKGVSLLANGRYTARVKKSGKFYHLGRFNSAVDAAHAYDAMALYLFGKFAFVNFK